MDLSKTKYDSAKIGAAANACMTLSTAISTLRNELALKIDDLYYALSRADNAAKSLELLLDEHRKHTECLNTDNAYTQDSSDYPHSNEP